MHDSTTRRGRRSARGIPWLLALACTLPAAAHDFWLQPDAFLVQPAVKTALTLQVGHGASRQRSPIRGDRITRFDAIAPEGTTLDLRAGLHPGSAAADGDFALPLPGTWLLVLQTDDRAQSHLPAERYNHYLEEEGLTSAMELRARAQRTQADGSERYGRVAKAIVQVGATAAGASPAVAQPIGLPLEIVLEASPHAASRAASLPIRVFREGEPLAGALVKLTDLAHDDAPVEVRTTDSAGRARFTTPGTGDWLLNVVWTTPLPDTSEVEFATTFSSLSFGVPPPDR